MESIVFMMERLHLWPLGENFENLLLVVLVKWQPAEWSDDWSPDSIQFGHGDLQNPVIRSGLGKCSATCVKNCM